MTSNKKQLIFEPSELKFNEKSRTEMTDRLQQFRSLNSTQNSLQSPLLPYTSQHLLITNNAGMPTPSQFIQHNYMPAIFTQQFGRQQSFD